jgi:hypothetical protein
LRRPRSRLRSVEVHPLRIGPVAPVFCVAAHLQRVNAGPSSVLPCHLSDGWVNCFGFVEQGTVVVSNPDARLRDGLTVINRFAVVLVDSLARRCLPPSPDGALAVAATTETACMTQRNFFSRQPVCGAPLTFTAE